MESLSTHRLPVLAAFGLSAIGTVANYTYNIYLPILATKKLGIAGGTAYTSATMAAIVLTVFTPVMGWLSDKTGRKPILLVLGSVLWPAVLSGVHLPDTQTDGTQLMIVQGSRRCCWRCMPARSAPSWPTLPDQGAFHGAVDRLRHVGHPVRRLAPFIADYLIAEPATRSRPPSS